MMNTQNRPNVRLCTATAANSVGDRAACVLPMGHYGDCDFIERTWLCHGHDDCRAVLPAYAKRMPWLLEDNPREHRAGCRVVAY